MRLHPQANRLLLGCTLVLVTSAAGCAAGAAKSAARSTGESVVAYVDMRDDARTNSYVFTPRTITVKTGTRVVWRNRSSADHTVTSSASPPAFDSGTTRLIHAKARWSFVFRHPGRYAYSCLLHPYMKGFVVVKR